MRMHPILANTGSRQAQVPMVIDGVNVAVGDYVTVSGAALHYRADVYPDPHHFLPERFVDKTPDPYAWLPFGGGSRRCLGIHFALYQMKCLAAVILQKYRLQVVEDAAPVARGFFVLPKHGLRVRVSVREQRPNVQVPSPRTGDTAHAPGP
jgi:cytochrome P450